MFLTKFKQEQNVDVKTSENKKDKSTKKTYVKKHSEENVSTSAEERIVSVLGKARSRYVVELITKSDEMTEEDLEIVAQTQEHLIEEQKEVVEEEEIDNFVCSMSKCFLPGCVVHTLTPDFIHYCHGKSECYQPISKMSDRMKKGLQVYQKHPECSYVEVYDKHICVVSYNGTTTVISE